MNRISNTMLLLAVVATSRPAMADALREDEVEFVSDMLCAETDLEDGIDLRACWPVASADEIDIAYSAVGWGLDPLPEGATVRLNLLEWLYVGGEFTSGTVGSDLATGLTGKGTYRWVPSDFLRKGYRIRHETMRDGQVIEDETFCAYFDTVMDSSFQGAVLGVSQPVVAMDDARHPWFRIGGDGDGLRNAAGGATLSFAFRGEGTFAAELLVEDGTVTVEIDGLAVATVPAGSEWRKHAWPVAGYDAHMVRMTCDDLAEVSVRGCALTDSAVRDICRSESTDESIDLRVKFPVASLEDTALKGLMYSANSWERNADADASRTAMITAQAGTLANSVFTPDGSAEVTVATGLTGAGTVNWNVTEISKKVYQLTHTVRKGGTVDAAGTLYGYLDFTHSVRYASQADVEAAVSGAITHKIAVIQDECWPWQPIDSAAARSGLVTDEWLEPGEETATTVTFKGRGVLHYDYSLSGGELAVIADGEIVSVLTEATTVWEGGQVSFDGYGAHEVSFAYTAVGGAVAAIRNVRWEEQNGGSIASGESDDIRMDLQEGEVRTPKRFSQVLPFAYSPTNFIGTVDGTLSRVGIVQLAGDDSDVTKWGEVLGTWCKLKEAMDEGEVIWRAKKGVWKATFEIFDGETLKDTQIKFFDLRNASGTGMVLMLY